MSAGKKKMPMPPVRMTAAAMASMAKVSSRERSARVLAQTANAVTKIGSASTASRAGPLASRSDVVSSPAGAPVSRSRAILATPWNTAGHGSPRSSTGTR